MPVFRFYSAVCRKGLLPSLKAGVMHLLNMYRTRRVRQWYRKAHASNERFDRLHGVETSAVVEVLDLDVAPPAKAESNRCQSIYEDLFKDAFSHLRIDYSNFVFLDFGSGKGKALLLASLYPFRTIVGVEFSHDLCEICKRNIEIFKPKEQKTRAFEVLCIDARQYDFSAEATVFFFFNPFTGALMQAVLERIAASLRQQPRPAWIVYCNPDCASYIDAMEQFEPFASGRRFRIWRTR